MIEDEQFFYLNDMIWCPKYQDLHIFNVKEQQLKKRLRDITSKQDMFMPIDMISTKIINSSTTIIACVVSNLIFLFQADGKNCELFFVFEFDYAFNIAHVKMRRDKETKKLWILLALNHSEEGIVPHLIDISYDKLVLNMTYEGPMIK